VVDREHARWLARGWAETAGELGEVVGSVETLHCGPPVVAVDEVVPLGDEVAQRAAVVTERHAAVHAPRSLVAQHLHREGEIHLAVVGDPLRHRTFVGGVTRVLEEARACTHQLTSSSWARSARRYSSGITLTKCSRSWDHVRSRRLASVLPVRVRCRSSRVRTSSWSSRLSGSSATDARLQRAAKVRSSSRTYATPPLMPAAKLRPVAPRTTTVPPVMYSQPLSPTPSTTATAPELRTAKRSPAIPFRKASPLVAPYNATLPMRMFSSAAKPAFLGG